MITINEFRIGNYVQDKVSGEWMIIDELGPNVGATLIDRSKFPLPEGWQMEGIPLTPEILEKCGFMDMTDGYRATGSEGGTWRIASPIRGQNIDIFEKYEYGNGIAGYFLGHFEFVMVSLHQLQNLFFSLTGEELIIKETV